MSQPDAIVFVHAHPDDECVLTGATLAKAASLGLRTIVVYGSRGDAGVTNTELGGEALGDRRVREAEAACAELGVSKVEWLPYADSGMADTATTTHPDAFSNQPPVRLAIEVAELLAGEHIAAVVGYDANGTYGHPDHRQVHHVAHAAVTTLGAGWVLDATYNREYIAGLPDSDGTLDLTFAAAEADLTHYVTGDQWLQAKLRALANHRSQIPDDWVKGKPDIEGFRNRFGTEWYIATPGDGIADLGILQDLLEPKPA
jgi:LmbE family N-acetylglucosaminyl deacetylase